MHLFFAKGVFSVNYFTMELKRSIFSKSTLIAFILGITCLIIGCYEILFIYPDTSIINAFMSSYSAGTSSVMSLVFPIIVCIPFVSSYTMDLRTGYINYLSIRMNIIKYAVTRLIINGIISALLIVSCFIVALIIIIIFSSSFNEGFPIRDIIIFKNIYNNMPIVYILLLILNSAIVGLVVATFGLGFSTIIRNTYLAIIFPFLFYIFSATMLASINKFFNMGIIYDLNYFGDLKLFNVLLYDSVLFGTGIILFLFGVIFNREKYV